MRATRAVRRAMTFPDGHQTSAPRYRSIRMTDCIHALKRCVTVDTFCMTIESTPRLHRRVHAGASHEVPGSSNHDWEIACAIWEVNSTQRTLIHRDRAGPVEWDQVCHRPHRRRHTEAPRGLERIALYSGWSW